MSVQNHTVTSALTTALKGKLKTAAAKVSAAEGKSRELWQDADVLAVAVGRIVAEWFEGCPDGTTAKDFSVVASKAITAAGWAVGESHVRTRVLVAGQVASSVACSTGGIGTEGLSRMKRLTPEQRQVAIPDAIGRIKSGVSVVAACESAANALDPRPDAPAPPTLASVRKDLLALVARGGKSGKKSTPERLALLIGSDPGKALSECLVLADDLGKGEHRTTAEKGKAIRDSVNAVLKSVAADTKVLVK